MEKSILKKKFSKNSKIFVVALEKSKAYVDNTLTVIIKTDMNIGNNFFIIPLSINKDTVF